MSKTNFDKFQKITKNFTTHPNNGYFLDSSDLDIRVKDRGNEEPSSGKKKITGIFKVKFRKKFFKNA